MNTNGFKIVAENIVCILLIILQLHLSQINLQIDHHERIDGLLDDAVKESNNFNFNTSILYSKKALHLSEKNSYKTGIMKSNYQIAYDLCNLGNYDKSLDYVKVIENNFPNYIQENFRFNFLLTDLKGRNYLAQGFKRQAKDEFRKEINLSKRYKNPEEVYKGIIYAYTQLSASCDADSSYIYLKKILALRSKIRNQDDFYFAYCNLSDYFIEKNEYIDSAAFYNDKALRLGTSIKSKFLYMGILQKADILFRQREFKESLKYTFQGLKLSKDRNRSEQVLASYKLLANNYKELKDYNLQSKFLDKYSKMNDSIFTARQGGIQASADRIFADKIKSDTFLHNNFLLPVLGIVFLFLIMIFMIYRTKF